MKSRHQRVIRSRGVTHRNRKIRPTGGVCCPECKKNTAYPSFTLGPSHWFACLSCKNEYIPPFTED